MASSELPKDSCKYWMVEVIGALFALKGNFVAIHHCESVTSVTYSPP